MTVCGKCISPDEQSHVCPTMWWVYLSKISVSCLHGGISCPEARAGGCVLFCPSDVSDNQEICLTHLERFGRWAFFFRGGGCFYLKWLRAAGLPKHSARVESKPGRCRGSDGATELHKLSLPSPAEVGQQNIQLLQSASSWTPTTSTNFACKRGGAVLVEASDPFLLSHSYSVWCRRTQIINILSTSLVIHWNLPTFALL